jgi:hypothetical protein
MTFSDRDRLLCELAMAGITNTAAASQYLERHRQPTLTTR